MSKVINYIKELRKTEKGRATLFFVFFFFFFLFLAIWARIPGNVDVEKDINNNYSHDISIDKLLDNNFSYVYTVEVDRQKYIIDGKINENVEKFNFSDQNSNVSYYRSGENYYINNNVIWEKGNVPLELSKFFNTKKLNELIKKSTLDSKTEYINGNTSYNFLISTNIINDIVDDKDTDFDDIPNSISVYFDKNSVVNKIVLELNSYVLYNKMNISNLTITLEYSDIGKIGVINNPLNN